MKFWYLVVVIVGVVLIWFGYYAILPFFINVKVDDALPAEISREEKTEIAPEAPTYSSVMGTFGHSASGNVRVLESDGKKYIRYENFKTINGPDIYVYLAKDLEAKEFVSLGRVKGTEGNINYEIPKEISVADYSYVLTWCKAFGVLFNYAELK